MIYQLIYTSRLRPGIDAADLLQLSDTANTDNRDPDITGVMLAAGDRIVQILEGPKDIVVRLFKDLKVDPRHSDIITMASGHNPTREFTERPMALKLVKTAPGLDAFESLISETSEFCDIAA